MHEICFELELGRKKNHTCETKSSHTPMFTCP